MTSAAFLFLLILAALTAMVFLLGDFATGDIVIGGADILRDALPLIRAERLGDIAYVLEEEGEEREESLGKSKLCFADSACCSLNRMIEVVAVLQFLLRVSLCNITGHESQ